MPPRQHKGNWFKCRPFCERMLILIVCNHYFNQVYSCHITRRQVTQPNLKSNYCYINYFVFQNLFLNLQNMTAEERTLGELTQQIAQAHQSLQGVRPDIAELQYLIEAQQLDNYGLEYYPAKVTFLYLTGTL